MKRTLAVVALVLLFVPSPRGQQNGNGPGVEMFLSQVQTPVWQCVSVRQLQVRAPFGMSGSMKVETRQDQKSFSYRVVREEGSEHIRNSVFRGILERERRLIEQEESEGLGFSAKNYRFSSVEKTKEGLWKTKATPLRKGDLLTEHTLFVDSLGRLVFSRGKLSENPSFFVRNVRMEIEYQQVLGIRMPVRLKSTAKVLLLLVPVNATLEMEYQYRSINGAEVEVIK